ncbi:hypothetical protein [Phenylobacterium sp.]|jgi:hypothetical protein|uniref:hypothetical protein n=1 Tax=Phenylobacterium sp. TaxID=1871053 RepID=UPI002E359092|nr:hypothetical protein [Phenylobacterium sp.]HEX3367451.1 hypothetical protein [Phenylobacterium sp.]
MNIFGAMTLGLAVAALWTGAGAAGGRPMPPTDCRAHVGYDLNAEIPGYRIPRKQGPGEVCVPVALTAAKPPPGFKGDFYVDEFTDAKLRERWLACKADAACDARLEPHIAARLPPNREHRPLSERARYLLGKIDADNPVADLATVRRPAFFAAAPYREPIAAADGQTFVVEFTAEVEPYERLIRHMTGTIKLRGWYLRGTGVDDGAGHKVRALILMSNGGGGRLTGIQDPGDRLYHLDPATGAAVLNRFPSDTTGAMGQAGWRRYLYTLNAAGFDVLSYDRRGVGLSGGYSDTNTLQQGRDILHVVTALQSGEGMRVLTPAGRTLAGLAAAEALRDGVRPGAMPMILGGNSRGTMATGFAMMRNFDRTCEYDAEAVTCGPPVRLPQIKGAMMLADFTAGPGYVTDPTDEEDIDRALFEGGTELAGHIVFFPSSGILASAHTWPALFIGRGVWDYAESLEGAIDAYDRVSGPKELVVVRGPHPFETWPAPEQARVGERMVAFAQAVALGRKVIPGGQAWRTAKDLVATTPDLWEASSDPSKLGRATGDASRP